MDTTQRQPLYLRLRKRIGIRPEKEVTLGQAARLLGESEEQEQRLGQLVLYRHSKPDGNRVVIDLLQIVSRLRELEPGTVY